MAFVRCDTCNWAYLRHRQAEHRSLHPFLPSWPCLVPLSLPCGLEANDYPMSFAAIMLQGIYNLQPDRQVSEVISMDFYGFPWY